MGIKINLRKQGFTLIEMVVVVGVVGFVLPILFAIVFLIIQQQARIYSLQEVKNQGDQALLSIRGTVKQYAEKITNPSIYPSSLYPTIIDICPVYPTPMPTTMPFIFFFDRDSVGFSYELLDNKIASQSPGNEINNLYLTNDKVKVSNLKFTCYRTSIFSPPVVYTSFDVVKSNELNPTPLQYSTKFQLRNY